MKQSKYLLFLLIAITIGACKKSFLEVTDNSNINRQAYVKDLNSLQEFMNGVYLMLSAKYEQGSEEAYPGLIADELKVSSISTPLAMHNNWSQVKDAIQAANFTSMNLSWMNYYNIIRACNFVIENVGKYTSENPDKGNSIKGQALAIRAMIHLRLVNIFAQNYSFTADASHSGIPYITTSDITKAYSRQTVAEVYQNMITDLEAAIPLMPIKVSDTRYMNAPAAKALLARIYLYKEDFVKAKSLSIELISQHPLMSINAGYPVDMFKYKQQPEQTEVLFQITPITNDYASSDFIGIYFVIDYFRATADIATILMENTKDPRRSWVTQSGGNWMVTKFPAGVAGGLAYDPSIDYYVPVVRSSEMFLTAAEASAKTNDETNARLYLNAIRKRADPTIADIVVGGPALLDSICKERRKEFCFEGFRMWDLQRWKLAVQRTDVVDGFQKTLPYPSEKAIAPIPGQDVNLMGLNQNPGY
ncbi:RagB/SusD family nutrient uptake outer membrane protein [Paraflavitalea soli]|uniref:RagB/SusD family nutrient uptake outer membrane protein n=1 Tax=Paraflavitalea soli TaxID=2315862 RepID=A0A3B7ML65_9BACT|nr:RagB/SusD family nutrient uptake outer membrane protein [Paraflavitalea soli]AXY75212.1 RagB/SusD family nutrient uptake outer membrane protein [Paraflavitalea soli]